MSNSTSEHNHSACTNPISSLEQNIQEIQFEKSVFNACVYGDIQRVRYLIQSKGNKLINEQDEGNGYSCLHYAARNNHLELCKLLLKSGADPNLITNSCKSSPLHRAAYMGLHEIVKLLLEHKSDPLLKDCDGKNALHKCVQNIQIEYTEKSSVKKCKNMLTAKVLIDFDHKLVLQTDKQNKTPLDYFPKLLDHITTY